MTSQMSAEQGMKGSLPERHEPVAQTPKFKVVKKADGVVQIAPDHPDPASALRLLMQALGSTEEVFMEGILSQLANAGSKGNTIDAASLNFMLTVVTGMQPADQTEAMLGAQMAAVHVATMVAARRLANSDNVMQHDAYERAFNKLARTFATQVEALKRYRTGGQQKMVVEHVTVNEGGQAIVGAFSGGGRRTGGATS